MSTPWLRLSKRYGPVPIGSSDMSGVSSALAGICLSQYIRAGSTPSGPSVVICTVYSSTASAPMSVA